MLKRFYFLFTILIPNILFAQHTFSIVAVDTASGLVGSAGASCIDISNSYNINRINEIIPGKGVINAQANWDFTNSANAKRRMGLGDSPEEIIDWLKKNDSRNRPQRMQYGIADIHEGTPRSATFTGTSAMSWAGHTKGSYYAIQGNILIGKRTIDSMETYFLRAQGTFTDRMMYALQGANFAGADKRCRNEGVSSRSAFIRVAKPNDQLNNLYLDLDVPKTPYGVEPIDELQKKYDIWRQNNTGIKQDGFLKRKGMTISVNQSTRTIQFTFRDFQPDRIDLFSLKGTKVHTLDCNNKKRISLSVGSFSSGCYIIGYCKDKHQIGVSRVTLLP